MPDTIVLAGSAIGKIAPKSLRITGDVRDGDAIIFLASIGRADQRPEPLPADRGQAAARLPDADRPWRPRTYGEALLAASVIYVDFVASASRPE